MDSEQLVQAVTEGKRHEGSQDRGGHTARHFRHVHGKSELGYEPVKEYRFHPTRKWRFDYAIPALKIAVECDGGVWTGGRHVSPKGYMKDMEKFNAAAELGWVVLKYTPQQLVTIGTIETLRATITKKVEEMARQTR